MPSKPSSSSSAGKDEGGERNDAAIAKAAGFIVFSGIALSLIRSLSLKPRHPIETPNLVEKSVPARFSGGVVEIAKGDTLWGLAQKYGVTINAIKEANGITGDTIYAGKKLIIP